MKLSPLVGTTPWREQTRAMRAVTLVVASGLALALAATVLLGRCLFIFAQAAHEPIGPYSHPVWFRGHTVFVTHAADLLFRSVTPVFIMGGLLVMIGIAVFRQIEDREKDRRRGISPVISTPAAAAADDRGPIRRLADFARWPFPDQLNFVLLGFALLYRRSWP
jgi:hypothetical protein